MKFSFQKIDLFQTHDPSPGRHWRLLVVFFFALAAALFLANIFIGGLPSDEPAKVDSPVPKLDVERLKETVEKLQQRGGSSR